MIHKKLYVVVVVGFFLLSGIGITAQPKGKQTANENKIKTHQDVKSRTFFLIGLVWGSYTRIDKSNIAIDLECNKGSLKVLGVFVDVKPWLETRAMAAELVSFSGVAQNGTIFGIASEGVLYWTE